MLRVAVQLFCWFAFLTSAVAFVCRFIPVVNHTVLIISALSPFLMLAAAAAAAPLLVHHRWIAAMPCLALVVTSLVIMLPRFIASRPSADHTVAVRVLTANLRDGAADTQSVVNAARERADVLLLQELTPEQAKNLSANGLDAEFPYRAVDARPFAAGIGIWSRHPIVSSSRDPGYELGLVTARLRVPGSVSDLTVVSLHLVGPWPQPIEPWRREIAALPATLGTIIQSVGQGSVVVAGDFNATTDMRPFRQILDVGLTDAAAQAGAGLTLTFPADAGTPPLAGIDHILTVNSSAADVDTVAIPGSDHRGLYGTIRPPAS